MILDIQHIVKKVGKKGIFVLRFRYTSQVAQILR
jgi:hypothetical protein